MNTNKDVAVIATISTTDPTTLVHGEGHHPQTEAPPQEEDEQLLDFDELVGSEGEGEADAIGHAIPQEGLGQANDNDEPKVEEEEEDFEDEAEPDNPQAERQEQPYPFAQYSYDPKSPLPCVLLERPKADHPTNPPSSDFYPLFNHLLLPSPRSSQVMGNEGNDIDGEGSSSILQSASSSDQDILFFGKIDLFCRVSLSTLAKELQDTFNIDGDLALHFPQLGAAAASMNASSSPDVPLVIEDGSILAQRLTLKHLFDLYQRVVGGVTPFRMIMIEHPYNVEAQLDYLRNRSIHHETIIIDDDDDVEEVDDETDVAMENQPAILRGNALRGGDEDEVVEIASLIFSDAPTAQGVEEVANLSYSGINAREKASALHGALPVFERLDSTSLSLGNDLFEKDINELAADPSSSLSISSSGEQRRDDALLSGMNDAVHNGSKGESSAGANLSAANVTSAFSSSLPLSSSSSSSTTTSFDLSPPSLIVTSSEPQPPSVSTSGVVVSSDDNRIHSPIFHAFYPPSAQVTPSSQLEPPNAPPSVMKGDVLAEDPSVSRKRSFFTPTLDIATPSSSVDTHAVPVGQSPVALSGGDWLRNAGGLPPAPPLDIDDDDLQDVKRVRT